jgi:outer membrane receptor protein involved in Fe transport
LEVILDAAILRHRFHSSRWGAASVDGAKRLGFDLGFFLGGILKTVRYLSAGIIVVGVGLICRAHAQDNPPVAARSTNAVVLPTIDIFATTPLSGTGGDVDKVPAGVTIINANQIEATKSADVAKALTQQTPSATINEVAGNPFQPDVEFRGFTASPVSGTPQGLAVYQNGVRINEAFGDSINWDLIPTIAVRSIDVISNNPAFGLNALGGALSVQMKDGFTFQGTTIDLMGGSYGRLQSSVQSGKQVGDYSIYGALEAIHDHGYRDSSPSEIRRFYGDIGYKGDITELHLNVGAANNTFGATAAAPIELLEQSWSNIYTTPQASRNEVGYVNATATVNATPTWTIQGAAHIRVFNQSTLDGNTTDAAPCDADSTLLCFNGDAPANGPRGAQLNNRFPPDATLGETDRTSTHTTSIGAALQATDSEPLWGHDNHLVIGGSLDYGVTNFGASAELGIIQPNYFTTSSGVFLGPSGDPVSDGPVSLRTTNLYSGLYALDTFDLTKDFSISGGGRLNVANIELHDQLGGALSGDSTYSRFNPMIGATYKITPQLTAYAGYSEANRAPTPLEFGCADPLHPCIVASFLVSDPMLKQVVARTLEAGLRGSHDLGADVGSIGWKLGVFHTDDQNDILNVPSPDLQGCGYFQNVGATRRQGVEAEFNFKSDKFAFYANYAYVDATFRNALSLTSNSPFADDNGNIQVAPGDQIPMIPRHRAKLGAEYSVTDDIKIGIDAVAVGAQYYVGDESNQSTKLPAYAVLNASGSYQITKNYQVYARVENLLDNHYYTYGTFFDTGGIPNFANGGAAFADPRTLSPAQPRSFYVGLKGTF